jgi:DMSO/TMAO reductase YedYZ heme-binding membrane subunit
MTKTPRIAQRINTLLSNSRFWILTSGITISFFIAGFVQLFIPEGSLQTIRIEQLFGFLSFLLLYLAVLASPFTKVFPKLGFNKHYLHARRAIGVLSFYYAFLHVYITFFTQLNGFSGLGYFNAQYNLSLLFGFVALCILAIMTMTSLDWAVKKMHFKNWKLLHRLVYIAGVSILIHVAIIGPHYTSLGAVGIFTYGSLAFLLILEIIRIRSALKHPKQPEKMQ